MNNNKITKYSYVDDNAEEKEYFIGAEIASLIGYKNTKQSIQSHVSEENKTPFKNYLGVKEPKIDSRQILINKDGVYQLLNKTKNTLSEETINIFKEINIDVLEHREHREHREHPENNQLTKYSYIDDNAEKKEFFIGDEIASLIGYKNTKHLIKKNVSEENKICFKNYLGVKEPKIYSDQILINKEGVFELLNKTNNTLSEETINIFKEINIDVVLVRNEVNQLTKYSYVDKNSEEKEYFIGAEIASLIGYKNTKQSIQSHVSEENKIAFKNYLGVKEPKIDSRQILINKDGIYEILNKNRNTLSEETINIFKGINIDIIEDEIEYVLDDSSDEEQDVNREKNELTVYEYNVRHEFTEEYFVGYEIVALLGYKNITHILTNNVSKSNRMLFGDFPGIKKPKLDNKTILITRDGSVELLIKTRKRISPDAAYILKKFNIETTNRKSLTKEQQTLSTITNVFKTEKFEDQYKIDMYYIDLFFSDYKIVIECDENGHADRKPWKERDRQDYVNEKLDIDDSHWIRYNPDEYEFDISKVIGRIYRKMDEIKEKRKEEEYRKLLEEENRRKEEEYRKLLEEENKRKEEEYRKLEEENKRKEEEYRKLLEQNPKKPKKSGKRIADPNIINEISTCTVCNSNFKSENNLKIHMKKVHNIGDKINKKCIGVMINNKNYDINIDSDNMINASLLCKETGKIFHNYRQLRKLRYEIGRISKKFKIPDNILMISANNIAWIHVHLLPHFSNWVSEYFGGQIKEVFDTLKIIENLPAYVSDKVFNLTLVNGQNLELTVKNNNYININNLCKSSGKIVCNWKKRNLDLLRKYKNPILEYSGGLFAHPNLAIMISKWCGEKYTEPFLEILKDNPLFDLDVYNGKQSVETREDEDEFSLEAIEDGYEFGVETCDIVIDEDFILEPRDVEDVCSLKTNDVEDGEDVCKTCKKWKTCEECKTCKICKKKFATKPKVRRHFESVHQKIKYKCEFCQTELSSKESLKTHINTVHKKKNVVKCDICDREYVNNSSLQLHIKSFHEKVTNESCKICNAICTTKYALQTHMQKIHGEGNKINCHLCDKVLDKDNLDYHIYTVHQTM